MAEAKNWLDLARKVNWKFKYVTEDEVFPEPVAGTNVVPSEAWAEWDEPYKTTYRDYVNTQYEKDLSVLAVRDAVGRIDDIKKLDPQWMQMVKLHNGLIVGAEASAAVGEARMARFGRDSAWRTMAVFGALDEIRHYQIPLIISHEILKHDPGIEWTHKTYHTTNWASIIARHFCDDFAQAGNALDTSIQLTLVFETGFSNLEFVALSAMADKADDPVFEKTITSIQTDESRHAQIGGPTLEILKKYDPDRAQHLLDKQFWRCFRIIQVLSGMGMDYMTPLKARPMSFKEFMEEWVVDQYLQSIKDYGMKKPWYWDIFQEELEFGHHSFYFGQYLWRSTIWADMPLPGPEERKWLNEKYPRYEETYGPMLDTITKAWKEKGAWATSPDAVPAICNICQFPTQFIRPGHHTVQTMDYNGRRYVFCSEPCKWIFQQEPEKFEGHNTVVDRIINGTIPPNLQKILEYFGITNDIMGRDLFRGKYPWMYGNSPSASHLHAHSHDHAHSHA